MDPSKRFLTVVLAAGVVVLISAIAIGERMGTRVFVAQSNSGSVETQVLVTPLPQRTPDNGGYGPDWKRSQTLTAAPDPHFPDPRVPPVPLPTARPQSKATATPTPAWTPNPKIPIWDQTPPPSPSASPSASPSPAATLNPNITPAPASTA